VSRQSLWARQYQQPWRERSEDESLPLWLRVACVAFGWHEPNGHTPMKPGELAVKVGRVNRTTGEVKPVDKRNLQRAIKTAIDKAWISKASGSLCLVVPEHAVDTLLAGHDKPCPRHKARKQKVRHSVTYLRAVGTSLSDPPWCQSVTYRQAADLRKRDALSLDISQVTSGWDSTTRVVA
jgi:hypothetical protein